VAAQNPDNAFDSGLHSVDFPLAITNCIIRHNITKQVNSNNSDAIIITYIKLVGISICPVQNHNID
jgi:hypothetical protein